MRLFQGGIVPDGHQAVLKAVTLPDVVVDVARGNDADAQLLRQVDQALVAPGIPLDKVLLQLQEVVAFPEEAAVARGRVAGFGKALLVQQRRDFTQAAAGQGNKALGAPLQQGGVQLRPAAVLSMGLGDEPAEVAVPQPGFGQEGEVKAAGQV